MRNLLNFIVKHYFFFLFIILEFFAISTFIQNNYFQRASAVNSMLEVSGFFYKKYNNIVQYFSLRKSNQQLLDENTRLHSYQPNSYLITTNNVITINDTIYRQRYKYINAKVINNSVNKQNNYLTLNKGSIHGICKEMAVISTNGIVGIIKDVSPNFSSVISVLHKDSRISAMHKKSGHVGTIVWEGNDYCLGYFKDIPTHIHINVGDVIITSGLSKIFPEGIVIGTIVDYNIIKNANFFNIKVRFATEFNSISYVYIINNLMKEEQKKLEEKTQND